MLKKFGFLLSLCVAMMLTPSLVFGQICDMQLWDVQVPDDYAGGHRGSEGFFFTGEALYWNAPHPHRGTVGNPNVQERAYSFARGSQTEVRETVQTNSWTADQIPDSWNFGQRYSIGCMNQHNGWEVSGLYYNGYEEYSGYDVQVGIDDKNNVDYHGLLSGTLVNGQAETWFDPTRCEPTAEGLKVKRILVDFDTASMRNTMDFWGIEANYIYRCHPTRIGIFEGIIGVRYFKYDEDFVFNGGAAQYLGYSNWNSDVQNNLVGLQLGLRWSRQIARLSFDAQCKVLLAYNAQIADTRCYLGANTNASYDGIIDNGKSASDHQKMNEFSPMLDFGFHMNYNLTRYVKLSVGWSGIVAFNVARSTEIIDYSISDTAGLLNVNRDKNCSDVFLQGVTFGVTINR